MGLSVTTIAPTVLLTTLARVSEQLGSAYSAGDAALVTSLIRRASAAIESYCHRPFAREAYTETLPGFGEIHLQLARTPVLSVSAVSRNGQVVTDYSIGDALRGWLYRQLGWAWTVQTFPGLGAGGRFLELGVPLPRQEEPQWSVSYVAGYVLPPQNLLSVATVSVDGTDESFNDSANGFPALLKAGDVIETSGFSNAPNNGRHIVAGTPTTAKIVTTSNLTTELAAASRTVLVQTLPEDVEAACLETVKSFYLQRATDTNVVEKQLGPARTRYEEDGGAGMSLPPSAVGLLRPWVRAA